MSVFYWFVYSNNWGSNCLMHSLLVILSSAVKVMLPLLFFWLSSATQTESMTPSLSFTHYLEKCDQKLECISVFPMKQYEYKWVTQIELWGFISPFLLVGTATSSDFFCCKYTITWQTRNQLLQRKVQFKKHKDWENSERILLIYSLGNNCIPVVVCDVFKTSSQRPESLSVISLLSLETSLSNWLW